MMWNCTDLLLTLRHRRWVENKSEEQVYNERAESLKRLQSFFMNKILQHSKNMTSQFWKSTETRGDEMRWDERRRVSSGDQHHSWVTTLKVKLNTRHYETSIKQLYLYPIMHYDLLAWINLNQFSSFHLQMMTMTNVKTLFTKKWSFQSKHSAHWGHVTTPQPITV